MQEMLDTIRHAVADDATAEAKQAGALACQAILAALQTEPGRPLVPPAGPASPPAGPDPGQMLDLVIAKLSAMVEAAGKTDEAAPTASERAFQVPLIGIPTGLAGNDK